MWRSLLSLLMLGCTADMAPPEPAGADQLGLFAAVANGTTSVSQPITTVPVDAPLSADRGAYLDRWIAVKANPLAPCPDPDQGQPFDVFPLFARPSTPQRLSEFCVYERTNAAFTESPFVSPAQSGLVDVGPDHMAVAIHGRHAMTRMFAESYADMFLDESGPVGPMGAQVAPRVRIAVLDTSPTAPPGVGHTRMGFNLHGYNLAQQMHQLTCNQSNCVGAISTRLAMDLRVDDNGRIVSDPRGGDFGSLLGLAQAIEDEVFDWQTSGVSTPLVINLSLGWNPIYGGDGSDPTLWPPDVRAVHAALSEATCAGALVVAAAGNVSGGAHSDANGPIYPARWAEERVNCAGGGGVVINPNPSTMRKLLWAVGAVDEDDQDLSISRPNSRPSLVAYADHATVADRAGAAGPGMFHTMPLTGTSVSTAVVSAAAAAVWENLPGSTNEQVMELLWESGTRVGDEDSFYCLAGTCEDSRRVRVCDAVEYACDTMGGCTRDLGIPCEAPQGLQPEPNSTSRMNRWRSFSVDLPLDAYFGPRTEAACGTDLLFAKTLNRAPNPCPDKQRYVAGVVLPHTQPQPHNTACPVCTMDLVTGEIYLEQDQPFSMVESITLHLDEAGGSKTYTTTVIPPGNTVTFSIDPALIAGTETAKVSALINGEVYISALDILE